MTTNYNNGKIYKIVDNLSDMVYIGSTCKLIQQRFNSHKRTYRKFKNDGNAEYVTSFKILENNDCKVVLIKNYPCNNKQELELEESKIIKEYIKNKLNIVNKNIPIISDDELKSPYYKTNKDKINEKASQKHNCCCGGRYTTNHKARHEKSDNHQEFIQISKIINYRGTINIYCNSKEDLNKLNIV